MIQREYEIDVARDVSHETLRYERSMMEQLRKAQDRVDAITRLLEKCKEQRLQLEVQSIN
jgi:hypothetical protein